MTHKPPPVQATLQINGGPPITVTVDELRLVADHSVLTFPQQLRLLFEFPWTQEFADWWRALASQAAEAQAPVSALCQADAHLDCRADCRCWCHSTRAHHIPYLTSDNCEACGRTPEEMVPDPVGLRRANAELRRKAAIRAQEGGEQR